MCADILTKAFTNKDKWNHACRLINHCRLEDISWIDDPDSPETLVLNKPVNNPKQLTQPRQNSGRHAPASPALKERRRKVVVEFCCGEHSKISSFAESYQCESFRLTIKEDMSTKEGLAFAMDKVKSYAESGYEVLLWSAIPCTGGSPWQAYNIRIPGVAAKIRKHIALYRLLFANFKVLANYVSSVGGIVVNEWPRGCSYWQHAEVRSLRQELLCHDVVIHGCALNLMSIVYPDKYIYI